MSRQGLKLLALLSKRQPPSSRLRLTGCFDDFRAQGIEPTALPIPSDPVGRVRMLGNARCHDVVVLQKKTSLRGWELKLLRRANPRLVFDMDDAVMFHELEHRQPLTGKNFIKFVRTVTHCAAVVAGNTFLARFAEPNCPRVVVLPTPIDVRRYVVKNYETPGDGTVTIGWLGLSNNLRYLGPLGPVFQRLALEFPKFRLKIVSNDFIDIAGVPIIKERWTLAGEIEALRSFDIGIMPLDDSLWAHGKCGYKILQYMGVAVPAVASPVGINTDFVRSGRNGFLAATEREWEDVLRQLISSPDQRQTLGLRGRADVEEHYSLARYAARYANLLRELGSKHRERVS